MGINSSTEKQTVTFEIYFYDLSIKTQQDLLRLFKTNPDEENWDTIPLTLIERELEEII